MFTRIFKNGHSQAVRIPAELAYDRYDLELEIDRVGDEIHIRPAQRRLDGVLEKLKRFSSDFMEEGRDQGSQKERKKL